MEPLSPEAVDRIGRIAADHRRDSLRNLVVAARYAELRPQLTPEILQDGLRRRPGAIDEWLLYSGDKRTSTGWYFNAVGGGWEVGYLARRGSKVNPHFQSTYFRSGPEACSAFILRDLDDCVGLGPAAPR